MKSLLVAAALLTVQPTTKALAQEVLIRGATVHTVSNQGTLKNADVLIRGGSIAAIGNSLAKPAGATVIEAKGRPLTPGLFGGLTTIGVEEVSAESQTVDSTLDSHGNFDSQQWRPEFDVTLAFNPRSNLVAIARLEGITWEVLTPGTGNSIIAGEGAGVSLEGRFDAVIRPSRTLFIQMGSDGARATGHTRAAEYMLLDQAIRETKAGGQPAPGALLHPIGREVLSRYLSGGRVVFAVDRAADILQTIAYAKRNGMKPVISGGAEAWVVAKELAQADVPVVINPTNDLPIRFDALAATLDNAARLHRAGVRLIFSDGDASRARLARQLAGNAVAHGLPWEAALAAITANPAAVFGVGATQGHIAVGQSADLVLWSADPLELSSLADQVWIAGHSIDMRSRQTELRDRYAAKVKAHQAR